MVVEVIVEIVVVCLMECGVIRVDDWILEVGMEDCKW